MGPRHYVERFGGFCSESHKREWLVVIILHLFVDQRLNSVLLYLGSRIREGDRPNRRPERVRLEHHTTWSFPAGYVDS
jgi:hypothetical protein